MVQRLRAGHRDPEPERDVPVAPRRVAVERLRVYRERVGRDGPPAGVEAGRGEARGGQPQVAVGQPLESRRVVGRQLGRREPDRQQHRRAVSGQRGQHRRPGPGSGVQRLDRHPVRRRPAIPDDVLAHRGEPVDVRAERRERGLQLGRIRDRLALDRVRQRQQPPPGGAGRGQRSGLVRAVDPTEQQGPDPAALGQHPRLDDEAVRRNELAHGERDVLVEPPARRGLVRPAGLDRELLRGRQRDAAPGPEPAAGPRQQHPAGPAAHSCRIAARSPSRTSRCGPIRTSSPSGAGSAAQ